MDLHNCQVALSPNYKAFLETASPTLCKQTKTCLLLYMIICLPVYLSIHPVDLSVCIYLFCLST